MSVVSLFNANYSKRKFIRRQRIDTGSCIAPISFWDASGTVSGSTVNVRRDDYGGPEPGYWAEFTATLSNNDTVIHGSWIDSNGVGGNFSASETTGICGNSAQDPGEACDAGSMTCDINCTSAVCGDFLTNSSASEQCDDGNAIAGDGCEPTCVFSASSVPAGGWTSTVVLVDSLALSVSMFHFRNSRKHPH